MKIIKNSWTDNPTVWLNFEEWKAMKDWYGGNREDYRYKTTKQKNMKKTNDENIGTGANIPGLGNASFSITLKDDWFKPEWVLNTTRNFKVKITKVNKFTWWKKFLFNLGFKFYHFDCMLIKDSKDDKK